MKDIEEMTEMWNRLDEKLSLLVKENSSLSRQIRESKLKTSRERLINRYWGFIILEAIWIILFPLMICYNPFVLDKYRVVTAIYWSLFFALEMGVDIYLMTRLRQIDVFNQTVDEISARAADTWKIHKLSIIIGLPLAIGAVILFAASVGANKEMMTGIFFGLGIGVVIGLLQLRKFLRDYDALRGK